MTRAPIVVLGAMTQYPVAGIVWLTMQYVLGFRRLGYDCYYVESHGGTPRAFVRDGDDGAVGAAAFLADLMARFDLERPLGVPCAAHERRRLRALGCRRCAASTSRRR